MVFECLLCVEDSLVEGYEVSLQLVNLRGFVKELSNKLFRLLLNSVYHHVCTVSEYVSNALLSPQKLLSVDSFRVSAEQKN